MLLSGTSADKEVKILFIISDEQDIEQCSDRMKLAFQECQQKKLNPSWIKDLEFDPLSLPGPHCFVLDEFKGQLFDRLKSLHQNSVVVGPSCLRTCISEEIPIPDNSSPVFNMAMWNLMVTFSQFPENVKKRLKELVLSMGGRYSGHLLENTTHLVTNSVRSPKYYNALKTELKISIMTVEWVQAVWEANLRADVIATDEQFSKYRCPVFYGLEIAVSNFTKSEKAEISKLINQNGGRYNPQLSQATASVLVVGKPEGEKLKNALAWDLPCVTLDWIKVCVKKNHAVSTSKFLINPTLKSSTPAKDVSGFGRRSDPSISGIGFTENHCTIQNVNETGASRSIESGQFSAQPPSDAPKTPNKTLASMKVPTPIKTSVKTPVKTPVKNPYNYKMVLAELNIQDAKKASSFLDGCKVFLSGFNTNEEDVLRRILNAGGATRYTELSDLITHMVVGAFISEHAGKVAALRKAPHVVTLEWIKDSLRQGYPANEENYLCSKINQAFAPLEAASPLSQRGLRMLQPEFRKPLPTKNVPGSPMSKRILRDYSNSSAGMNKELNPVEKAPVDIPEEPANIPDTQESDATITNLFEGLSFKCSNLDNEEEVRNDIVSAGGKLILSRFSGVPDYTVVPVLTTELHATSCEVITYLWIKDCLDKCKILDISFYHQPVIVKSLAKPLIGCVLTSSNYIGQERTFIRELGEELGAQVQEVFAKKNKGEAAASTHLICPTPEGNKYNASLKWKLPAVTISWIVDCAQAGNQLPVGPYLVKPADDMAANKTEESSKKMAVKKTDVGLTNDSKPSNAEKPLEEASSRSSKPCSSRSDPNSDSNCNTAVDIAEQQSMHSLGNINTCDFNTPLANSTIDPARFKRKSDSPLENNENESSSQQTCKGLTPESRKRWKKFTVDGFEGEKTQDHSHSRPAKRLSTPISELRKKICTSYETSFASSGESSKHENLCVSNAAIADPHNSDSLTSAAAKDLNQALLDIDEKLGSIKAREGCYERISIKRTLVIRRGPVLSQLSEKPDVEWKDPVEVRQRERELLEQGSDKVFESPVSTPTTEVAESRVKKFILSSIVAEDKELYQNLIKELGGVVLSDALFSPEATHLVMQTPIRSEKLLCSMARGLWILHPKYIVDSMEKGAFLEEEEYEWGNSKSKDNIPLPSSNSSNLLASAAHRWRTKIKSTKKLAFSDVRALIFVSKSKADPVNRLIQYGGGEVLTESELDRVTHCFIENPASVSLNWTQYAEHHIFCLNMLYLSDFLTADPLPNPVEKLIPEYVPFYRQYLYPSS